MLGCGAFHSWNSILNYDEKSPNLSEGNQLHRTKAAINRNRRVREGQASSISWKQVLDKQEMGHCHFFNKWQVSGNGSVENSQVLSQILAWRQQSFRETNSNKTFWAKASTSFLFSQEENLSWSSPGRARQAAPEEVPPSVSTVLFAPLCLHKYWWILTCQRPGDDWNSNFV